MSDTPTTLDILIDVRARLEAVEKAQHGLQSIAHDADDAHRGVSALGSLFAQGLGIGTGMELASRAIGILKSAISASIGEASRFAGQAKDMSEALQITTTEYQVLGLEFRNAGVDAGRMTEALSSQTRSLAEARDAGSSAAKAYEALGLNVAQVERTPVAERLGIVARAVREAKDQTLAFSAASQILGSRGLPQLLNALQRLATDGLAKVTADWEKAGSIMSEDTITRLDRAQKKWESFWHSIVVHSGEALAGVQRFVTADLTPDQGAVLVTQQTIWDQERKITEARKRGVGPSAPDLNLLAGLRENFSAAALRVGDAMNVRAALDAINKITEADRARGALTPRFDKTKADVIEANRQLDIADKKSAERQKAQVATIAKAALLQRDLAAAEQADAEAVARQEETRGRLQSVFDENNAAWENARAVVEANLDPLERYNRELDRLYQLQGKIPAGSLKRAFDAAKEQFDTANSAEFEKSVEQMASALRRLQSMVDALPPAPPAPFETDAQRIRGDYSLFGAGKNHAYDDNGNELAGGGGDRLSARDGVQAGAMQWVMSLGTQGEQLAQALESSVGTTVHGISDAIRGWATGAEDFGDVVQQMESSLFQTLLDTLVQMGAQWLINAALAKGSMVSTFLVGVGLRKAEAVDTVTTEAAKTPSLATNAALASAGSFGLSAVIGIALLAALVGAFAAGGFADGGYTGAGSRNQVAGLVHAGEVVWSQENVKNAGGVAAVEALRLGGGESVSLDNLYVPSGPSAAPVAAPALSESSNFSSSLSSAMVKAMVGAQSAGKKERLIAIVPDMNSARALQRDPAFENVIVDVMQRRKGEIFS